MLVIGSRWQNLLTYGFLFVTIVVFPRGINIPRCDEVSSPAPVQLRDRSGAATEPQEG